MHGKNAKATGFRRIAWTLLALLAAVAMLLVCSMPASAEDTAGDGSSDTQSSQSQNGNGSGTWADQADGTATVVPGTTDTNSTTPSTDGNTADGNASGSDSGTSGNSSDATDNANADDATSDGTAADGQQSDPQAVSPAATGDCAAVSDWDTLVSCVRDNVPADGILVTIAKTITAPANSGPVTIGGSVTLTADDGVNPALTASTGDALFIVNGNHTLTLGKDANDASFSYKNAQRWLALMNKDAAGNTGTLVINNGTFDNIKTPLTYDKDNHVRSDNGGSVAVNDGGTFVINGGSFSDNSAANGGVFYQFSGSTMINNATFSNNTANEKDGQMGGVYYQNGGSLTINSGEFKENKGWRGGVVYSNAGTIDVHGGTFDGNSSNMAAGVFMQNSKTDTMTVDGGTFSNNKAGSKGGVIHNNGTLTITSATFTGNQARNGGGAISQDSGSTAIVPNPVTGQSVMFKDNAHTVAVDNQGNLKQCNTTTGDTDDCWRNNADVGGGAIYASSGKLNIQGAVTFDGNYSRAWGYMDGGGAIYIKGELWVQNDVKGTKPKFINNYSGVEQRGADGTAYRGGAGGAIFLQEGTVHSEQTDETKKYTSRAYILGGYFENNTSGYLGGAIYTEAKSVTYVAKAVATKNTAGHFGGGLWLCPSGTGTASKGGNIALFENSVTNTIDPNNSTNGSPYPNDKAFSGTALTAWETGGDKDTDKVHGTVTDGDGTEAGADFAIMNPMWKGEIGSTSFQLMDTWFTDRTKSAVDWYTDGTPIKSASGFQDYFADPKPGWHTGNDKGGTNLAVTKTGGRYGDGSNTSTKMTMGATHTHVINMTRTSDPSKGITTGIALKATKADGMTDEEWESAKAGAWSSDAVQFTNNSARLSGGAFATNGDVKFSTPYTASWTKVDAKDKNQIGGATWTVSTTGTGATKEDALASDKLGGPFSADFDPGMCAADASGILTEAGTKAWNNGICWKQEVTQDKTTQQWTVTNSMRIIDNQGGDSYLGVDNNPDAGGFDINNLHNGTYTLEETSAPTGYTPELDNGSKKKYTFTVNNAQAQWDNTTNVDKEIGNTRLKGVSWGKVDVDSKSQDLPGSVWTVTEINADDGTKVSGAQPHEVTDCVDSDTVNCEVDNKDKAFTDTDGTVGKFNIFVDKAKATYKLVETKSPDGYWMPTDNTSYRFFSVDANSDDKVQIYKSDGKTEVPNNDITNTQPNVSWSKVAKDNGELLAGSEWEIYGPLDKDGNPVKDANGTSIAVTAKVTDCVSENNYCDTQSNDLTGGTDGTVEKTYADVDRASGKFRVKGLKMPSDAHTEYTYQLTETEAPQGFVLSTTTYQFVIGHNPPTSDSGSTGDVTICTPETSTSSKVTRAAGDACAHVAGNKIANIRQVTALPFTGGVDAREWLLYGGAFAVCAAVALALVNEYRKRKGLNG
ncbi:SpaA isopeptide-forming pilin-related protein [Bifidobacterium olomucense]|uniref:SpaA-like prealbumin fold domain-containing protein n=1 Tax=Bifidobacterium olomucense TaxID=2675324 RepID=A0A7Y0EY68_9BIFI|nr:SpaA isopeptide-forming pilin-related protein [Bifidobacterium sp. DSM 109959]NMM98572.1 hypothetical protein [Bifidobacterium sp. DSM 109959]